MLARVLAASVAGGITFVAVGFVLYGLILDPMVMKPNIIEYAGLMKDMPSFVPLVLGNIVGALLLAYIFERWASIRTFVGGMKAGAILWFLVALYFQLMFMAFMNLTKNYVPVIADVIGSAILGAIGGGVIGLVLGLMNKSAASE